MALLRRQALITAPRIALPYRPGTLVAAAVVSLVVIAAALQVNQFSRATSASYEINALTSERAAKQAENHGIEAEVGRLSSLARVDLEARIRLHMAPATQTMFLTVNQAVPQRDGLPTRFLPREGEPAPAEDEPIWRWALRFLPGF
jgi:hypothetical protein